MTDSRAVDSQSRLLVRTELLTNIFLEAGAGSGKTQMLAERMAAGVAAGVYEVEKMAAVTFTRKAASELRGRFHLALEAQLAKDRELPLSDSCAAEQIVRVQSALSNLERFFGGTIHSFCARLLRERPVESGVSPGFTELDEAQDFELRQRVWRDFVTNARSTGDPEMLALLDADIRPPDLDSAFATLCTNEDVDFPPGGGKCPDAKAALLELENFWTELQRYLPPTIQPESTCPIQQAARQFQRELHISRLRLDRPSVVTSLLKIWDCKSKITQKWWGDSVQERKRLLELVGNLHGDFHAVTVAPYLTAWRQYVYRLSVTLLNKARDAAASERRRINSLNYGDLLNLTARVLRENESVRSALQKKFQFLLVDEFQDTDPVQAEIVFWLAEDNTVTRPTTTDGQATWQMLPLRPGALFVVGDPKQSIYRFRRADIDIYNIVRNRFSDPSVGLVLPLTLNYRSAPQLCTWANDVFQTRFPAEATAHAPCFAALDASDPNQAVGAVFTLSYSCDNKTLPDEDAERIAAFIQTEVKAGRRSFRDFLILTRRKRGRIAPYADALNALNIPVEVSGAGAFGGSLEVKVLTLLLRALADPQDALSLIAILRGPLFGVSDSELFRFKRDGGWFSLFYEPGDVEPTSPPSGVQAAIMAVHRYYRWTRVLPAAAALDRILEDTGYLALEATSPGGVNAGDILHAVDRVRQVVENGGSLADAADALEADGDAANEVESLPLEPGRSDVVRLMNLHKAKGLEAKVVFLADPTGGLTPRVDVHIERTGSKALGWMQIVRKGERYNSTVLGEHHDWSAHETAELPYLKAEEDRLLYVAATRARDTLVISRSLNQSKSPAWGVLNNFLAQAQELTVNPSDGVSTSTPLNCEVTLQEAAATAQTVAHDAARQPSWTVRSATAEARHIARMTRSIDASSDDPTKVVGTDTPSHGADSGHAWGTLIHGLLEHVMRQKESTSEDLRRLGMWLTVEQPELRPVLDLAVKTVLDVSHAAFWNEAKKAEHSVETPFAFRESYDSILTGVIDLLYRSENDWRIIDYKTDAGSTDLPSYKAQLKMYERALDIIGIPNVTSSIQPVRGSKE